MAIITSEYQYWPFVVSVVVLLGLALIISLIALIFFAVCTCCKKKTGFSLSSRTLPVFAICGILLGLVLNVFWAILSGFDIWHPAWTAVFMLLTWIILCPTCVMLVGRNRHLLLREPLLVKETASDNVEMRSLNNSIAVAIAKKPAAESHTAADPFLEDPLLFSPQQKPEAPPPQIEDDDDLAAMMLNQDLSPQSSSVSFGRDDEQQNGKGEPKKKKIPTQHASTTPSPSKPTITNSMQTAFNDSVAKYESYEEERRRKSQRETEQQKEVQAMRPHETSLHRKLLGNPTKSSPLRIFFGTIAYDIRKRWPFHIGAALMFLVVATITALLLHGICFCSKPSTISTWLTRRLAPDKPSTCKADGTPCFTYVMVGDTCSSLVVVSHMKLFDSSMNIPVRVSASICPTTPRASPSTSPVSECSLAQTRTVPGVLRDNDNILEDRRYIANVPITNLTCGQSYTATVTFTLEDESTRVTSKALCFHTLPPAPSASVAAASQQPLSFIGGGDYVPGGGKGIALLRHAMARQPIASFAFIGGDIAYDNNVRTCYKRVDQMLYEVTQQALIRPQDKCQVPLLVGMGNHDGGGYLWVGEDELSTQKGRMQNVHFYDKYFPKLSLDLSIPPEPKEDPVARDPTLTYATYDLSGTFGLIVLDSGSIAPMDAVQKRYLQRALNYFRNIRNKMPVIVLYHNPIFPSRRGHDEKRSKATREAFLDILNEYDDLISLVLENHDHNYKRTKRLVYETAEPPMDGNATQTAKVLSRRKGRGLLYSGDGALGAFNDGDLPDFRPEFRAVAKGGNYVLVVNTNTSVPLSVRNPSAASLVIEALGENGNSIDSFIAW